MEANGGGGIFSNASNTKQFLMHMIMIPRISLHCKLVPGQYLEMA